MDDFAYSLGPQFHDDDSVTFRVWAPECSSLGVRILVGSDESHSYPMQLDESGVFAARVPAVAGDRYWIELPGGQLRPDPVSRFQPEGVHGPSQLIDIRRRIDPAPWRGIPRSSLVLYEIHVGTFTREGTYAAAAERLGELAELGVTAVELMPLAETAGNRNWGYDGVNFYAPRNSYGTPAGLAELVDAAHGHGMAVILDVVYNHFGPEGNYLHEFGGYISAHHRTAWGDAPNFDGEQAQYARRFVIENALYWIQEYGFDGLRLDAIHCMYDHSPQHIVTEIGSAFEQLRERTPQELHLIAESNVYDPEMLTLLKEGGHGYDAAWCDDFLHAVFAILSPGVHMSVRQYERHADLDVVLRRGYVYQGTLRKARERVVLVDRGEESIPLESLVYAIQNHDFIGNQPHGRRLHQLVGDDAHRAAAALLLLHPAIPMLFMGEEFASPNGFEFFADFGDPALRQAVEEGRKREYPQHDWEHIESPLSVTAFQNSYIGSIKDGNPATLQWYRRLIALRKQWRRIGLLQARNLKAHWDIDNHLASLQYRHGEQAGIVLVRLHCAADAPQPLAVHVPVAAELSLNCRSQDQPDQSLLLDPFAVAIFTCAADQIDSFA
jgi:maltooligosyltrehalose trehalohydrolase